jgi:hypothetical protein
LIFNKAKCEECEIFAKNGNIHFKKYLESFYLKLTSDRGDIAIKRLGLSGKGEINSKDGNITIDSLYTEYEKIESKSVENRDPS